MGSPSSSVLTEELLAAVEQVCLAARSCGVPTENLYHEGSGDSGGIKRDWSVKEMKKWLT